MLRGIWVRIDNFDRAPLADYLLTSACLSADTSDPDDVHAAVAALSGSLVYIQLEKADFKIRIHLPDDRYESVSVVRWQFPLTHAMVRTAMSSQGRTFPKGVVADLRRTGGMTDDIWWLNIYVILSRATRMDNLLLLGLDDNVQALLEKGPPTYVREKIIELQRKAIETMPALEDLARKFGIALPT